MSKTVQDVMNLIQEKGIQNSVIGRICHTAQYGNQKKNQKSNSSLKKQAR